MPTTFIKLSSRRRFEMRGRDTRTGRKVVFSACLWAWIYDDTAWTAPVEPVPEPVQILERKAKR